MGSTKYRQKNVGNFIVLSIENYESVGYAAKRGSFKDGEVAVFLKGITKSLQRRENYPTKISTLRAYRSLSSSKKIESWIRKRGY